MVTAMSLPALRCFPFMLIQVPPERGPRSGDTCEKVGVCQRETQQVHSPGGAISVKKQPKEMLQMNSWEHSVTLGILCHNDIQYCLIPPDST